MNAIRVRCLLKPLMLAMALLATAPSRAQTGEDVPFITTPDNVTLAMLQLAQVGPRDHLIDLGSGDGRIVITAAKRFGATGLGVEIVPDLVAKSRSLAQQAGVGARAEFLEQDLFKTDLSRATVVTMYLLPEVNMQLRPALLRLAPGTRIVSHDWDLGDWLPDSTTAVDAPTKVVGRDKRSHLHRWVVPAQAGGDWCGAAGQRLRITQRFQQVQAQWRQGAVERLLQGQLQGRALHLVGADGPNPLRARVLDDRVVLTLDQARAEPPQSPTLELVPCPSAQGPIKP
jgi:SAM-dependent methyltransferase